VCSRATARACRQKDGLNQNADYGNEGGRSGATRALAHDDCKSASGNRGSSNLGDQVLALATGRTQQEIAAARKGARANHVGAALSRHKRLGRVEERDGKLYAIQSTRTE
jgi:hypothetical protein